MEQVVFEATSTPLHIALQMVRLVGGLDFYDRVLVPGAGCGSLAFLAKEAGADVTCIELNASRCAFLRQHFADVRHADFLRDPIMVPGQRLFTVCLMNPPLGLGFKFVEQAKTRCAFKQYSAIVALLHDDQADIVQSVYGGERFRLEDRFEFQGKPVSASIIKL